jgi:hypothetical protein
MNLQFVTDNTGHITAVQIPIKDWKALKKKYKGFEEEGNSTSSSSPEWHNELVENELKKIENGTAGLVAWETAKKQIKL